MCHTANVWTVNTLLLLDLPSESERENLVDFIYYHCPLNIKAKLLAADDFSLKQKASTSTLVNLPSKSEAKNNACRMPSNNNSVLFWYKL